MRVPWTARRSNQSILKEISPEYSLEGLMLKLKFQYVGHLMQRADSSEKTLMLGKIEGRRRRGRQRMRWLDGIINTADISLSRLREVTKDRKPDLLQSMGSQTAGQCLATEQQQQQHPGNKKKKKTWTPLSICPSAFTLSDRFLPTSMWTLIAHLVFHDLSIDHCC